MTISDLSGSDFAAHNLDAPLSPLLVTVPHAGRDYPDALLDNLAVSPAQIVPLEDRHADLLAAGCIAAGFPVLIARRPRAWIDLNRAANEIDADLVEGLRWSDVPAATAKVRGGLGLIPRRVGRIGNIWRRPISRDALEQRAAAYHRPFHDYVADYLIRAQGLYGGAVLLDLHSMPPLPATPVQAGGQAGQGGGGALRPQIVLGDLFGQSASPLMAHAAEAVARDRGFGCAFNHPYAGGHILRMHGHPAANIHAIQLEIDRSLYLEADLLTPSLALAAVADMVRMIAAALVEELLQPGWQLAAE